MTQTTSRWNGGNIPSNPKLHELVMTGLLDWDNEYHRAAYLHAWITGKEPQWM